MLENPLAAWLKKNNLTAYAFADLAGIAMRTAYRFAQDEKVQFETKTLLKIEAATGGEVTLRQLINWLNQPPPAKEPAPPPPLGADDGTIEADPDEYEDITAEDEMDE
jgi:transcriptional regulator with XRE-family HTH domain